MTNPDVMIPVPFAQSGLKNPINVTRQPDQDAQDATWQSGFPPVTMQRKEVGGLPPNGLDFNGVLYAVSADANHRQKGLSIEFNQDFANAIGGYPIGAKLRLTNGAYVESTVAGNTNNPNSNMTGWTPCIIDNLTTNDPYKPVSAKQAKLLQDSKLDANKRGAVSGVASLDVNKKVPVAELPGATSSAAGVMKLIDNLTDGGTDAAITAEMAKILNDQAFGVGQTWQNVRSIRMLGTTYTNTTQRTIFIAVSTRNTRANITAESLVVTLSNLSPITFSTGGANTAADYKESSAFFPVPAGASYKLESSTQGGLVNWMELR